MMNIYFLSLLLSLSFLVTTFELVRRQKLKEQYSLLWITFSITMLVVSLNVTFVEKIAQWMGVKYAPAILFLFGLLFCFAIMLHMTIVITKLSHQVLRLAQELTMMKESKSSHE
ncbi:DUF2304 domain-containing protein [Paenibacillus faecalis]|uniref:DUF2304 domain-containing protein n=1 Tax=Paenibacillus faecalis TaxID=2079532 RepID=UPI001F30136F|nr:DUF2304 domain-containing protein [Paenibacillus faecalis]